jgi:hypothetical protein
VERGWKAIPERRHVVERVRRRHRVEGMEDLDDRLAVERRLVRAVNHGEAALADLLAQRELAQRASFQGLGH